MEFFAAPDPPDPPPEEPEPDPRPWWSPPLRTLPGRLADVLVLHHSDRIAVTVGEIAAYPSGFSFVLRTYPRRYGAAEWAGLETFNIHPLRPGSRELRPELLRYGVELADGRRVTSLDAGRWLGTDDEPEGPTLFPRGSTHGGGLVSQEAWVWPLPPPGPLAFACEWPAAGVPLSRAEIDAERLHEAAARARLLWPDDGQGGRPGS